MFINKGVLRFTLSTVELHLGRVLDGLSGNTAAARRLRDKKIKVKGLQALQNNTPYSNLLFYGN